MVEAKLKESGVKAIIFGVAIPILIILDPNPKQVIPSILLSLILIITGIMEIKGYYNKKVYFTFIAVILGLIWIFIFINPIIPITNQITALYNLILLGVLTFLFGGYAYNSGNKMEKENEVIN